jgi:hypothetical protein
MQGAGFTPLATATTPLFYQEDMDDEQVRGRIDANQMTNC